MHPIEDQTVQKLSWCLAAMLLALPAVAQDIDWWTVDGGGEIASSAGDWELSGAFGQWDATSNSAAQGGPWAITGGFWGVNLDTDTLFKDSYES